MKKKFILKKRKEINFIFKFKKNVRNYFFILYYARNPEFEHFKFALSINKKYGKSHERNLIKRRLRMIIYNNICLIDKKSSFVLVIKPPAKNLSFNELSEKFTYLLKKSFLII
ncbi:ribonuclease P protein component [Candidatus Phytoplasma sacchari]|uniref:Ribonuclease P protein component n=1 Tax=Candidatus Phytoplasma sacchari TaxID=2609813 RepID=A0ABY7M390_9MOLU|nr:ribonuclease P protein component [Candidatus Phytoplasma sacchari]KAB8122289.1 ribonuclease P protein component [Candidatus Phytoplasma sacchari]WBL31385.1 ribonuclease P protein component [Candidatus Phytoplasma sacchari]